MQAVTVKEISKRFKLYEYPWQRAFEWLTLSQVIKHKEFWALKNISFEVEAGECFGIIGANGAGKSTLLKILSKTLYQTSGEIETTGRVLSLLELGTGFSVELTGRQNLYNSSSLIELPKEYVDSKVDDILAFAELGDFIDRPIKIYSSGMLVRLAFSMFIFLEPDILIIDEALSVGDVFFQQKCFSKIREIIAVGTTCLFVSHDMGAMQNLTDRALLLNNGREVFLGKPDEAVMRYYASINNREGILNEVDKGEACESSIKSNGPLREEIKKNVVENNILGKSRTRHGSGSMEIIAASFQNERKQYVENVEMMQSAVIRVLFKSNIEINEPSIGIHIFDRMNNLVFAAGTTQLCRPLQSIRKGEERVVSIIITFSIQPGEYTFNLACGSPSKTAHNTGYVDDQFEGLGPIVVHYDRNKELPFYGTAQLPMSIIEEC